MIVIKTQADCMTFSLSLNMKRTRNLHRKINSAALNHEDCLVSGLDERAVLSRFTLRVRYIQIK